jgi:hypothetical protein
MYSGYIDFLLVASPPLIHHFSHHITLFSIAPWPPSLGAVLFPQHQKETTMNHQDIIRHLCQLQPHRVVHEITENIISEIVRRIGEEALELSAKDLELARDEVKAAIEHHLDERDFVAIGLDAWELTRNL